MKAFKNNRLKISLMLLLLVCIVSCGPASGTAPITNQEEADREPASDVEVGTVTTETFSMDYFRFGQREKTLVILPGLSVQSVVGFAESVAEEYAVFKENYTVYVFDRRKELPESYPVREMARDTAEVIRALGLDRIDLCGASQGGMMAMVMAIEEPDLVRKVALASTSSCVEDAEYETIENRIRLAQAGDRAGLYLAFGEAIYPEAVFEQSRDLLTGAAETVTEEDLERFIILAEGIKGFDVTEDLQKIPCPVLVAGSMDDHVLGHAASVRIAENLGDREGLVLCMYDGYGHAVYDLAPDFRDRLFAFFEQD